MPGSLDERSLRAERRVGRVLGEKWRLERLIGMGGMAAVYAATHVNNLREAAIKVLHKEFSAKDDIRKRFLREGYIANKVGHPGAVTILDDGVDEDGSVFLVMELFHGETLHARARAADGKLPALDVLRIVDKLLDVLAAAHDAGVVHRDLKPENIFVTRDDEVKVLDFGIARLLEPTGDMTTVAGMLVGTPTYMPPEQIAGRMELIDGRTDIWAVGAIMFTTLSGRTVHEAKSGNAFLLAAMSTPARKLTDVLPEASPSISPIVDRALAFDRDDRFPDARAMQAAVREALATGARRAGAPKTGFDLEAHAPQASGAGAFGRRALGAVFAMVLLGIAVGVAAWARRRKWNLRAVLGDGATGDVGAAAGTASAGNTEADAASGGPAVDGDASADASVDADDREGGDDGGDDAGDEEDDDAGDEEEDDDAGDEEDEPLDGSAQPTVDAGTHAPRPFVPAPHKPPQKKPPPRVKAPTKRRKPRRKKRPRR